MSIFIPIDEYFSETKSETILTELSLSETICETIDNVTTLGQYPISQMVVLQPWQTGQHKGKGQIWGIAKTGTSSINFNKNTSQTL